MDLHNWTMDVSELSMIIELSYPKVDFTKSRNMEIYFTNDDYETWEMNNEDPCWLVESYNPMTRDKSRMTGSSGSVQ